MDYMQYWPRQADHSRFASDNLYLMKTTFHPGQLLFGQADQEAVGTRKKEVKRRLTKGTRESARSSTSSSRRSREQAPAVSSPGKRRRVSSLHSRDGGKEKRRVRSPPRTHITGNIECAAAREEYTQLARRGRQVP